MLATSSGCTLAVTIKQTLWHCVLTKTALTFMVLMMVSLLISQTELLPFDSRLILFSQ